MSRQQEDASSRPWGDDNAGNNPQEFLEGDRPMETNGNQDTMNINHMLLGNIRNSDYFKLLADLNTFDAVIDQARRCPPLPPRARVGQCHGSKVSESAVSGRFITTCSTSRRGCPGRTTRSAQPVRAVPPDATRAHGARHVFHARHRRARAH